MKNIIETFELILLYLKDFQTLLIGIITILVLYKTLKTMEKNTREQIIESQQSTKSQLEFLQIQENNKYTPVFEIDLPILHLKDHQKLGNYRVHIDGKSNNFNPFNQSSTDIEIKGNDLTLAVYITNKTDIPCKILLDTFEILLELNETYVKNINSNITEINLSSSVNLHKPVLIKKETLVLTLLKLEDINKYNIKPISIKFDFINPLGTKMSYKSEFPLIINRVDSDASRKTKYINEHKVQV